ncbi:hypothetical protein Trydic_g8431 [Trypoxylus dichotomus]
MNRRHRQPQSMTIAFWNANGLSTKKTELEEFVQRHQLDEDRVHTTLTWHWTSPTSRPPPSRSTWRPVRSSSSLPTKHPIGSFWRTTYPRSSTPGERLSSPETSTRSTHRGTRGGRTRAAHVYAAWPTTSTCWWTLPPSPRYTRITDSPCGVQYGDLAGYQRRVRPRVVATDQEPAEREGLPAEPCADGECLLFGARSRDRGTRAQRQQAGDRDIGTYCTTVFQLDLGEGCEIVAFADDTALLVRAQQCKTLKGRANNALATILDWSRANKLVFNAGKSEALFFGKTHGQQRPTFKLGAETIYCKENVKYLGVVIDEKLNFKAHVHRDIDGEHAPPAGVVIYMDGSKGEDGTGAAFVVYANEDEIHAERLKLDRVCDNYQAELVAINAAVRYVREMRIGRATLLLQALRGMRRPTRLLLETWRVLREVNVDLRWTRAHVGTRGNKRADELAKEAAAGGAMTYLCRMLSPSKKPSKTRSLTRATASGKKGGRARPTDGGRRNSSGTRTSSEGWE